MIDELVKRMVEAVAAGIELVAALVIAVAAVEAAARAAPLLASERPDTEDKKQAVRLKLGRWLAVGLEFELAADVLRTAAAPSWTDIGKLAAIIVLRTALNYFLQKEIDKAAERGKNVPA